MSYEADDDEPIVPHEELLDNMRMVGFDFSPPILYVVSTTWFNRYETANFWRMHNLREHIEKLHRDLRMPARHCVAEFQLSEKMGFREYYSFLDEVGLRISLLTSLSFPKEIKWRWRHTLFKDDLSLLTTKLYDVRAKARKAGLLREDQVLRALIKFFLNLPSGMIFNVMPDPDGHKLVISLGWKSLSNPDMINIFVQDSRRLLF